MLVLSNALTLLATASLSMSRVSPRGSVECWHWDLQVLVSPVRGRDNKPIKACISHRSKHTYNIYLDDVVERIIHLVEADWHTMRCRTQDRHSSRIGEEGFIRSQNTAVLLPHLDVTSWRQCSGSSHDDNDLGIGSMNISNTEITTGLQILKGRIDANVLTPAAGHKYCMIIECTFA